MATPGGKKEPPDAVRQNQLLCERVRKELQYQKLYTKFTVNPLHRGNEPAHSKTEFAQIRQYLSEHAEVKQPFCIWNPKILIHTITRKPMSWHDNIEEPADAQFLNLIHHAALEPTKKYSEPQTESQEIGWNTTPLIAVDRTDCRLYFPRRSTDITK